MVEVDMVEMRYDVGLEEGDGDGVFSRGHFVRCRPVRAVVNSPLDEP